MSTNRVKRLLRKIENIRGNRNKKRRLSASDDECIKGSSGVWTPKSMGDFPTTNIYNSTSRSPPAELFRKDLISAMKLPDSEPLAADEYWFISDQWKQEWERGVQVPVNPEVLPEPVLRIIRKRDKSSDFKLPKKLIRISPQDDEFDEDVHQLSTVPAQAEKMCRYDMDDCDLHWLTSLNNQRKDLGLTMIDETLMEIVMEELETQCYDKMQEAIQSEAGLGIEFDEDVICDVCRSPDSEEGNEMVFCDSCDICVHQACYGITSIPEGSWMCRTCSLAIKPDCILCPNKGGAMKSTRSGQKWAHVSCALWIPEVSIGCVEKMEPITKIALIPPSRWALICCLCRDRIGACIQCSVKSCKTAYHVSCGFQNGLDMKAVVEDENIEDGLKLRSYCPKHSKNKDSGTSSDSEGEDSNVDLLAKLRSAGKASIRAKRLYQIESTFFRFVSLTDVMTKTRVASETVEFIYQYWKLKRRSLFNKPLLIPRSGENDALGRQQEVGLFARMKMFVHLRQDLERVRNLCYMVSRREKLYRSWLILREQIFHKQVAVLMDDKLKLDEAEKHAVIHACHGDNMYDRLFANDPTCCQMEANAAHKAAAAAVASSSSTGNGTAATRPDKRVRVAVEKEAVDPNGILNSPPRKQRQLGSERLPNPYAKTYFFNGSNHRSQRRSSGGSTTVKPEEESSDATTTTPAANLKPTKVGDITATAVTDTGGDAEKAKEDYRDTEDESPVRCAIKFEFSSSTDEDSDVGAATKVSPHCLSSSSDWATSTNPVHAKMSPKGIKKEQELRLDNVANAYQRKTKEARDEPRVPASPDNRDSASAIAHQRRKQPLNNGHYSSRRRSRKLSSSAEEEEENDAEVEAATTAELEAPASPSISMTNVDASPISRSRSATTERRRLSSTTSMEDKATDDSGSGRHQQHRLCKSKVRFSRAMMKSPAEKSQDRVRERSGGGGGGEESPNAAAPTMNKLRQESAKVHESLFANKMKGSLLGYRIPKKSRSESDDGDVFKVDLDAPVTAFMTMPSPPTPLPSPPALVSPPSFPSHPLATAVVTTTLPTIATTTITAATKSSRHSCERKTSLTSDVSKVTSVAEPAKEVTLANTGKIESTSEVSKVALSADVVPLPTDVAKVTTPSLNEVKIATPSVKDVSAVRLASKSRARSSGTKVTLPALVINASPSTELTKADAEEPKVSAVTDIVVKVASDAVKGSKTGGVRGHSKGDSVLRGSPKGGSASRGSPKGGSTLRGSPKGNSDSRSRSTSKVARAPSAEERTKDNSQDNVSKLLPRVNVTKLLSPTRTKIMSPRTPNMTAISAARDSLSGDQSKTRLHTGNAKAQSDIKSVKVHLEPVSTAKDPPIADHVKSKSRGPVTDAKVHLKTKRAKVNQAVVSLEKISPLQGLVKTHQSTKDAKVHPKSKRSKVTESIVAMDEIVPVEEIVKPQKVVKTQTKISKTKVVELVVDNVLSWDDPVRAPSSSNAKGHPKTNRSKAPELVIALDNVFPTDELVKSHPSAKGTKVHPKSKRAKISDPVTVDKGSPIAAVNKSRVTGKDVFPKNTRAKDSVPELLPTEKEPTVYIDKVRSHVNDAKGQVKAKVKSRGSSASEFPKVDGDALPPDNAAKIIPIKEVKARSTSSSTDVSRPSLVDTNSLHVDVAKPLGVNDAVPPLPPNNQVEVFDSPLIIDSVKETGAVQTTSSGNVTEFIAVDNDALSIDRVHVRPPLRLRKECSKSRSAKVSLLLLTAGKHQATPVPKSRPPVKNMKVVASVDNDKFSCLTSMADQHRPFDLSKSADRTFSLTKDTDRPLDCSTGHLPIIECATSGDKIAQSVAEIVETPALMEIVTDIQQTKVEKAIKLSRSVRVVKLPSTDAVARTDLPADFESLPVMTIPIVSATKDKVAANDIDPDHLGKDQPCSNTEVSKPAKNKFVGLQNNFSQFVPQKNSAAEVTSQETSQQSDSFAEKWTEMKLASGEGDMVDLKSWRTSLMELNSKEASTAELSPKNDNIVEETKAHQGRRNSLKSRHHNVVDVNVADHEIAENTESLFATPNDVPRLSTTNLSADPVVDVAIDPPPAGSAEHIPVIQEILPPLILTRVSPTLEVKDAPSPITTRPVDQRVSTVTERSTPEPCPTELFMTLPPPSSSLPPPAPLLASPPHPPLCLPLPTLQASVVSPGRHKQSSPKKEGRSSSRSRHRRHQTALQLPECATDVTSVAQPTPPHSPVAERSPERRKLRRNRQRDSSSTRSRRRQRHQPPESPPPPPPPPITAQVNGGGSGCSPRLVIRLRKDPNATGTWLRRDCDEPPIAVYEVKCESPPTANESPPNRIRLKLNASKFDGGRRRYRKADPSPPPPALPVPEEPSPAPAPAPYQRSSKYSMRTRTNMDSSSALSGLNLNNHS